MCTQRAGRLLLIAALAFLGSCASDDSNTASFDASDVTQRKLPQITTTTVDPSATPTPEAGSVAPTSSVPPLSPLQGLGTELVADGFDEAVFVTGAPGTNALFVVEQEGVIRVVVGAERADEPFLDIRDRVGSSANEQGLLGLAFHPNYASNGRFFAYWTDTSGNSQLAEFSAPDVLVGDPDSMQILLEQPQPAGNHNGGMIMFGPDGFLYVGLGDGGGRPGNRSQNTETLLGAILRLDVSSPGSYSIPSDNPFGNEIWVYGLRNPWRFSIDTNTRLMYIGDVGQDRFEEIDVVSLDDGAQLAVNFGWPAKEGDSCFGDGCDNSGFRDPVLQYPHPEGCSVTGGWVYRGTAFPELFGHYFYADFCGGLVRSFRYDSESGVQQQIDWADDLSALDQVSSFGVDNESELYALNWSGELLKIVPVR
jgi:glucose/arabinose dehydrogenase